jgi:DNA-binding FadR family transcriptional regulator
MSINAVSPSASNFQNNGPQQMAQYIQTLSQALQSGNTQSAQQAYNSLIQNLPKQGPGNGQAGNPVQQKFAEIGAALKSGDINSAKVAMQAIEQHVQSHNNHVGRFQAPGSTAPASTTPAPAPVDTTSSDQSSDDDNSGQTFATGPARFVGLVA